MLRKFLNGLFWSSAAPDLTADISVSSTSLRLGSFYMPRVPATFGNVTAADGIVKDGLTDVYGDYPMGIW